MVEYRVRRSGRIQSPQLDPPEVLGQQMRFRTVVNVQDIHVLENWVEDARRADSNLTIR